MKADRRVIRDMARHIQGRLVRRIVAYLQRLPATLSGDDSGLRNVWHEICVQVQGEPSQFWRAYEDTICSYADGLLGELSQPERAVLSAATSAGDDWLDDAGGEEATPFFRDEVLGDLVEWVACRAMEDQQRAVRQYLDRY